MQAKRGIAWLVAVFWLALLVCAPAPGAAGGPPAWKSASGGSWLIIPAAASTSLETQMLGEKPLKPAAPQLPGALLPETMPTLQVHSDSDATLRLPKNLELNISIHYNRQPAPVESPGRGDSSLLMKYSMDYRVLSNLRVGLNGYLYRPSEDGFAFQRPLGRDLMGFGPTLKYDLGRWSFLLKSQVETGNQNRGEDLQNWLRVWYAF